MSSDSSRALIFALLVVAALTAMNHRLLERDRAAPLERIVVPGARSGGPVPSGATGDRTAELRVCADPNNLPFSNHKEQGFENAIATLIARELGREVRYTWWPQRRGFVRNTLGADRCDLVMGVPEGYELLETTEPYYRSTYVFVTRHDSGLDIDSFDDVRLRDLRIGVHAVGDDYASVPPAQALAARGLARNIRGYSIYGAYSEPDPPKELIEAVASGEVDVAVAWGPLAGYFARRQPVALDVRPVAAQAQAASLPMTFAISIGVRRGDHALRDSVEQAIARRRSDIRALLASYGVPLVDEEAMPYGTAPDEAQFAQAGEGS